MRLNEKNRSSLTRAVITIAVTLGIAAVMSHAGEKKGLFSDPGQYESLASGAFEASGELVSAPAPIKGRDLASQALVAQTSAELSTKPIPVNPIVPLDTSVSTPEGAFSNLIRGNERFSGGNARNGGRRAQKASTVILSCSDAQVSPESVFDQASGEIVSIQVPGHVLGSAQVAAIEHAILHLGVKLVVVMGHESCGAVKLALDAKPKVSSGSTDLDWLVGAIRPNLKLEQGRTLASVSPSDPKIRQPVMSNVDAVTEQLMVRSRVISRGVSEGKVKIVRSVYSTDSGRVDFWGMK